MDNPVSQGVNSVTPQTTTPPPASTPPTESHTSGNFSQSNNNNRKKTGLFAVLATVVLLAAVGVTVFLGQQEQDNRQKASEIANNNAGSCALLPTDSLIVFDVSNSMKQPATASVQMLFEEEKYAADVSEAEAFSDGDPVTDQEAPGDEGISYTLAEDDLTTTPTTDPSATPTTDPSATPSTTGTVTPSVSPTNTTTPTSTPTNIPTNTPTQTNFPATNTPVPSGVSVSPSITSGPFPTVPFPPGINPNRQYSGASKLAKAQSAMTHYVNLVQKDGGRVGLITFGPRAKTQMNVSNAYDQIRSKISSIKTAQGTCVSCAINLANKKFTRDNTRARAIILVSDGRANRIMRGGKSTRPGQNFNDARDRASRAALNAAIAGYQRHGVPFYTIALGVNADRDLMRDIATRTNGQNYFAPSEDELQNIYTQINSTLGKNSVSGQAWLDSNNDGKKTPGERLLANQTIKLIPVTANTAADEVLGSATVQGNNNKNKNNNNNKNGGNNNKNNSGNNNNGNNNNKNKNNGGNNNKKKNNKKKNNKNHKKNKNDKHKKKKKGLKYAISCEPTSMVLDAAEYEILEAQVTDNKNNAKVAGKTINWTTENVTAGSIKFSENALTDTDGYATIDVETSPDGFVGTIVGTVAGDAAAQCRIPVNGANPDIAGTLTTTTDANGNYTFIKICDGEYRIEIVPQEGYTVKVPVDGQYKVTMKDRKAILDKDFGLISSSLTVTPGPSISPIDPNAMTLNVTVFMHGIGKSGDNSNPFPPQCTTPTSPSCGSNPSPLKANRPMEVEVYGPDNTPENETDNVPLAKGTGTLVYNPTEGRFTGPVTLDTKLAAGSYSVKIKSSKYLRKTFPGITALKAGANNLPVISMVVGDSYTEGGNAQDSSLNRLDIRDYNALLGCFSFTAPPKDCGFMPNQKELTDLDDDGKVNDEDYNLFIRELAVQYGD